MAVALDTAKLRKKIDHELDEKRDRFWIARIPEARVLELLDEVDRLQELEKGFLRAGVRYAKEVRALERRIAELEARTGGVEDPTARADFDPTELEIP